MKHSVSLFSSDSGRCLYEPASEQAFTVAWVWQRLCEPLIGKPLIERLPHKRRMPGLNL